MKVVAGSEGCEALAPPIERMIADSLARGEVAEEGRINSLRS